jgi:hypothetical protein
LKSQSYFFRRGGGNEFIMPRAGNSISVKRAYIGFCPEMTGCRLAKSAILAQFRYPGVIPLCWRNSYVISIAFSSQRSLTMAFSYNTAAELFPAAIRKKKRAGFAYRRFDTAAAAVRFAIEELPADSLNGAYLQVDEARFDQSGIRSLYESEDFPLARRAPEPAAEPAPAPDAKADAA